MTDDSQTTEEVAEEQLAADQAQQPDTDEPNKPEPVKADVDNDALDTVLVKRVLEAAILVYDGPLNLDGMLLLFDEADRPSRRQLREVLDEMVADCEKRGIELREVASGFRYQAKKEVGPWVSRLWQEKPPRYSRAIMETLALIAYRQPITRGEIEEIRGVSVNTQIVRTLLERGWVRVVGHRDVPGRPAMYATTRQFLDYFDVKSLEDLPPLSEIKDLDKLNEELQLEETAQLAAEAHAQAHADEGEGGEPGEEQQQSLMEAVDEEPEIDESTLMSLEQVDSVLNDFESEFRKKPGKGDKDEADGEVSESQASREAGKDEAETDEGEEGEGEFNPHEPRRAGMSDESESGSWNE